MPIYIGDSNSKARNIKSGYVGIDGKARQLVAAYVGDANGKAKLVWQLNKDKLTSYKGRVVTGTVATETLEILGVQKVTDNKIIVCTMDKYEYNTALKAIYVYVINLNNDGTIASYKRQLMEEQDGDHTELYFYSLTKTINNVYGILSFRKLNYSFDNQIYLGTFDLNDLNGWGGYTVYSQYEFTVPLSDNANLFASLQNPYYANVIVFQEYSGGSKGNYELSQLDSGKSYMYDGKIVRYIKLSNNRIAIVASATDSGSSTIKYTAVSIWSYDSDYKFTRVKTTYMPACNVQYVSDLGNDRFIVIGNSQAIGFSVDSNSNVTYKSVCSHSISDVKNAIRIGTTNSVAVFGASTMGIVHCKPTTLDTTFSYYGSIPVNTIYGMEYNEYETLMVNINSGQLELSKYTYS